MAPQISSWNPKFIQTQFLMITIIITVIKVVITIIITIMITVIKVIIMDLMSISQVIMNLFRDQITTNLTLPNPTTMNLSEGFRANLFNISTINKGVENYKFCE